MPQTGRALAPLRAGPQALKGSFGSPVTDSIAFFRAWRPHHGDLPIALRYRRFGHRLHQGNRPKGGRSCLLPASVRNSSVIVADEWNRHELLPAVAAPEKMPAKRYISLSAGTKSAPIPAIANALSRSVVMDFGRIVEVRYPHRGLRDAPAAVHTRSARRGSERPPRGKAPCRTPSAESSPHWRTPRRGAPSTHGAATSLNSDSATSPPRGDPRLKPCHLFPPRRLPLHCRAHRRRRHPELTLSAQSRRRPTSLPLCGQRLHSGRHPGEP